MPVIGRLDEQVHEVLITPVSKKRQGGERPDPARRQEDGAEPRPSHQEPSENESDAGRDELPVWLL